MLRSGPIPLWLHGIIEYMAAVAFFVAPFLLDFRSDVATLVSVATGVVILVVAATSETGTGLVTSLPLAFHVMLDYVLALALIAAPFVFGFSDEGAPTAWFIALGAVHLLVTIGTRFYPDDSDTGVGPLAMGTSVDVEAGDPTVMD